VLPSSEAEAGTSKCGANGFLNKDRESIVTTQARIRGEIGPKFKEEGLTCAFNWADTRGSLFKVLGNPKN